MFIITHSTHWPGGFFHPVSSHSVPESYSLRPLPADPNFCTSGSSQPSQKQKDSFPTKTIWSMEVRQEEREQLAYLLLFPAWQKPGEKQSMGWSEKSIKNSPSTRSPGGKQPVLLDCDWEHISQLLAHTHLLIRLSAKQHFLPYELAGQMFHKMIYFIPMVQDTSWSRETIITGDISGIAAIVVFPA